MCWIFFGLRFSTVSADRSNNGGKVSVPYCTYESEKQAQVFRGAERNFDGKLFVCGLVIYQKLVRIWSECSGEPFCEWDTMSFDSNAISVYSAEHGAGEWYVWRTPTRIMTYCMMTRNMTVRWISAVICRFVAPTDSRKPRTFARQTQCHSLQ